MGHTVEGEGHPAAKLTEKAVRDLRRRARNKPSFRFLRAEAERLKVTPTTIHNALRGKTWGHVTRPRPFTGSLPASRPGIRKKVCKRGHPFDKKNTRIIVLPDGRRWQKCRACAAARFRKWYHGTDWP